MALSVTHTPASGAGKIGLGWDNPQPYTGVLDIANGGTGATTAAAARTALGLRDPSDRVFGYYLSADRSIPTANTPLIITDGGTWAMEYDSLGSGGSFNTTNGIFPGVAGRYQLNAGATWLAPPGHTHAYITLYRYQWNGTSFATNIAYRGSTVFISSAVANDAYVYAGLQISTLVELVTRSGVVDRLGISVYLQSYFGTDATVLGGYSLTYFNGYRVA